MPYAEKTTVPVDRSRTEIERQLVRFGASGFALVRFGASGFAYAWEGSQELIGFMHAGKQVRMTVPMPSRSGYRTQEAWERERRRRWRALAMVVKAKLVAVDEGILGFEDEFLSYFVMRGGRTIGESIIPRLEEAALSGELPPLMLPAGDRHG